MQQSTNQSDVLIVGGGLSGIVTAIECLKQGKSVTIIDRDSKDRFGGLAKWAFGGMTLVDTPLQRKMKIKDTADIAFNDWVQFGELREQDVLPRLWAQHYAEYSTSRVYEYIRSHGIKFMPAVNWVERGLQGNGNSLPRYHVIWGTSEFLTQRMIETLYQVGGNRVNVISNTKVEKINTSNGRICGVTASSSETGAIFEFKADVLVLATGGINGSAAQVKRNWPAGQPIPQKMLNGAHPFSDGAMHYQSQSLGAQITHADKMWNYAAGVPHPQPHFEGHGLSMIPCKSALWLDHTGRRIGPAPLVTGFDTHDLCNQLAKLKKPYSWQLLNWRIAVKEMALSGAEHNQRIRDKQFFHFLKEILFGNSRLVKQMIKESDHFIVADTLAELAEKMNTLTGTKDVTVDQLKKTADDFDANFAMDGKVCNDDQIRRILHARTWPADKLRTCKPAPLQKKGAGPFIAINLQLVTRKSLGGIQTDLQSRVLNNHGQPIDGLYSVGEAAGFGGGGASGKRSLEATFLPGCILTSRAAAQSIAGK